MLMLSRVVILGTSTATATVAVAVKGLISTTAVTVMAKISLLLKAVVKIV
jgi:hypothetical protein